MFSEFHALISAQARRLITEKSAASAVEYAMIASGVAVAIAGAIALLGGATKNFYDSLVALF